MSIVNQRTILIVAADPDFARQLSDRWQSERVVPQFTIGTWLNGGLSSAAFDLAVIGPLPRFDALLQTLRAIDSSKPVIVVANQAETTQAVRQAAPRALAVQRNDVWQDAVVVLGNEVLRRVEAIHRAEHTEQLNASLKCHATLGQYMIEMRHTLNNALTSVLGNSELLLLEPGAFSAGEQAQIDTIRHMALRMHEILQRFSSLEKELTVMETQAVKEQMRKPQVAAVGV
jgi:signal transduction histidine kinase